MTFVSITRLRIRSVRFLPAFLIDTWLSMRQVRRAVGYRGGALLADRDRAYWTMTAWDDAAAMRAYMTSGSHRRAMPKLMRWCDQASIAHWTQEDDTLPDWHEADRRMRAEGRASKVHHAAAGHDPMTFAVPRINAGVTLRPNSNAPIASQTVRPE